MTELDIPEVPLAAAENLNRSCGIAELPLTTCRSELSGVQTQFGDMPVVISALSLFNR